MSDNASQVLRDKLHAGDQASIADYITSLSHDDRVFAISRLDKEDARTFLLALPPDVAAAILKELPEEVDNFLVRTLTPEQAAPILDNMRSDRQADILAGLEDDEAEAILGRMMSGEIKKTRFLMEQIPDTAGDLMAVEYLSYNEDFTVADVLRDLRENGVHYSDYEVQYAYITDGAGRLRGVLRMRDLLFAALTEKVDKVMIPAPLSVRARTPLEELGRFFEDHGFFGVPVVDDDDGLVGVVRRAVVKAALEKRANVVMLRLSGIVGGEELRSMPLRLRAGRRLGWLSINIVLNIIAASVVAAYEDTLVQVIALAVFLPIISDMSGCAGNQAVAVSIRELSMGLLRPREFLRVFGKESAIGIINGIALGCLIGFVAYIWKGNPILGLVVGAALALNTLVAVCVGGLLPLVVKALKLDPALVSGPMLTTVTDMCGFFLALSLTTMALPYLV